MSQNETPAPLSAEQQSPEKIYLQTGEGDEDEPIVFDDLTWCREPIFERDVEYIRADIVSRIMRIHEVAITAERVRTDVERERPNAAEKRAELAEKHNRESIEIGQEVVKRYEELSDEYDALEAAARNFLNQCDGGYIEIHEGDSRSDETDVCLKELRAALPALPDSEVTDGD